MLLLGSVYCLLTRFMNIDRHMRNFGVVHPYSERAVKTVTCRLLRQHRKCIKKKLLPAEVRASMVYTGHDS